MQSYVNVDILLRELSFCGRYMEFFIDFVRRQIVSEERRKKEHATPDNSSN